LTLAVTTTFIDDIMVGTLFKGGETLV
jgi:hypothetical protein